MRRDLGDIADRAFDLAVVGGGVVGAFCACDAARRGLRVLLVEREDFGAAASEAMSHAVHGGVRYLLHGRFALVREGLAERNLWRRFAPHQVAVQPTLAPLTRGDGLAGLKRALLALYDRMGPRLDGADPGHWIDGREAIELEPVLADSRLSGAWRYDECRVDEPERAVLSLVLDAVDNGAVAANHVACTGLDLNNGRATSLHLRDELSGAAFECQARSVINAAGDGAEALATQLLTGQRGVRLVRSKGVHLVVQGVVRAAALALSDGKGHAFVAPWMGLSLVGTSDEVIGQDLAVAEPSELAELEQRLRRLLPGLGPLERIDAFAGVRALPRARGASYRAGRDMVLHHHDGEGAAGLFAVYGGKWTTARRMAGRAIDAATAYLGAAVSPCDTAIRPVACAPEAPLASFQSAWRGRLPDWPAGEVQAWVRAYGRRMTDVFASVADPNALPHDQRLALRLAHARAVEMAETREDLLHRLGRGYRLAHAEAVQAAVAAVS